MLIFLWKCYENFIQSLAGGIESARASISKEETLIIASSGHGHSSVGWHFIFLLMIYMDIQGY